MASLAEKRIVEFEQPVEHLSDDSAEQQPQTRPEELRLLEALLFASPEPLDQAALAKRMPEGVDVKAALKQLQDDYAHRGVNLVRIASKWTFRTAGDLAWLMTRESTETRKLSRAAIEMLAIIAYHQPITRAEIEEIRGVVTSKGTLDVLLETGWIKPRGRRKTPGRPLTFGTTEAFLSQFSLESLTDLPGLEELKGTGLLDTRLPTGFSVPTPSDDPALREDEDPLEPGDLDLTLAPQPELELSGDAAETAGTAEAVATEAGLAETSDIVSEPTETGFAGGAEAESESAATGFADVDQTGAIEAEQAEQIDGAEVVVEAFDAGGIETEDFETDEFEAEDVATDDAIGTEEVAADEPEADSLVTVDELSVEIETVEVELIEPEQAVGQIDAASDSEIDDATAAELDTAESDDADAQDDDEASDRRDEP
ncbi:SMC-Scp complex subunit ScpB [Rhodopseudomonas palustris]|uniref:SMC-Scp complex subunit ScpB n=1 Tax=Rhodopseudomonas palustris TaxID=1076 RepID=UPI000641CF5A|nr:SMC-Scp complex subunit ScpB [Rhodopseudomonas palustris]